MITNQNIKTKVDILHVVIYLDHAKYFPHEIPLQACSLGISSGGGVVGVGGLVGEISVDYTKFSPSGRFP